MAWLVIQVVETIFAAFGFRDAAVRIAVILQAIGLVSIAVIAVESDRNGEVIGPMI